MLKVLGRVTSINVRKVLWALDELNLEYEQEDWGLPLRDPNVPEFLALNPNAQVPVLVEGQFVLWESNAILTYLGEREGVLLPAQLEERALVMQWLGWQAAELPSAWSYAVMSLIRKAPGFGDPDKITDSVRKIEGKLAVLEGQLSKGQGFVAGDMFSVADIAIGLSVHRCMHLPLENRESLPAVQDYYERLLERPAAAKWMSAETP